MKYLAYLQWYPSGPRVDGSSRVIQMGMKNHDVVPEELIVSIAKLRYRVDPHADSNSGLKGSSSLG